MRRTLGRATPVRRPPGSSGRCRAQGCGDGTGRRGAGPDGAPGPVASSSSTPHSWARLRTIRSPRPGRRQIGARAGRRRVAAAAVGDLDLDHAGLDLPVHPHGAVGQRRGVPDGVGRPARRPRSRPRRPPAAGTSRPPRSSTSAWRMRGHRRGGATADAEGPRAVPAAGTPADRSSPGAGAPPCALRAAIPVPTASRWRCDVSGSADYRRPAYSVDRAAPARAGAGW